MMKALVVDDARSWVDFHRVNLLKNYGENLEIDCAYSAKEAYDWAYNYIDNPYDLIITDLQMENDYGDKFAGEWLVEQILLLNQYRTTKIIIVSGSTMIKHIAEGFGVDYIPKRLAAVDLSVYKNLI